MVRRIIERFLSLSNTKKVIYLTTTTASMAALTVLFIWASRPEYQLLFSHLSPDDAAAIINELKERRIPYRIEAGGAIAVPKEKVYETRLSLAGEGLPRGGGVGFEIFDRSRIGMTEFTQKVNYLRALQGELARTISWLAEIESARVHIVVPEKRLFLGTEEKARASVIVKLKPGKQLSYNQVQGIVHLIASSVEGLDPGNVTVVDTHGQMLTRPRDREDLAVLSSYQLEYQHSLERYIENRIQQILEPVVGPGKVVTRVSAEIDFKRVEKTEERYDPDSVAVRSEQRNLEKTAAGFAAAGVPGVLSNTPANQGTRALSGPAPTQRQNEIINYEISKVVSRIFEPSGAIKRLSVAVLVDGTYKMVKTAEGKEQRQYVPRSKEELKKFEDLVKSAVGFVADRGDTVEVVNIPFESQPEITSTEETDWQTLFREYLPSFIRYGTILILAICLYLFVLRPLIKGLFKEETPAVPSELPVTETAETIEGTLEQKALPSSADVKQMVIDLVKQNPQQAAQIIKGWLKEGETI